MFTGIIIIAILLAGIVILRLAECVREYFCSQRPEAPA